MKYYLIRGDIGSIIEKQRTIPEPIAVIYAAEVLLALENLHKRGIIFRDLKAENVVIDEDGHALLTDFGLSKEGIQDEIPSNSFCGSVAYLAPEILAKAGHNRLVDWYLFGAFVYEMLVGQPPYFSTNKYS